MTALLSAKGELLCKPLQTSHAVRDLFFQLVCYKKENRAPAVTPTIITSFHACRAKLKAMRHCLAEEDIDALAAAAHGFVGADLAAVCDEAAMAALRRIIASKQRSSADPPSPLPLTESYVSLNEQHLASQSTAKDQLVSSPQCRVTPTKSVQQAERTPLAAGLTDHAPDRGVAVVDTSACMRPSASTSAHAQPCGEAVGAASPAHEWQVRPSCIALTKHD